MNLEGDNGVNPREIMNLEGDNGVKGKKKFNQRRKSEFFNARKKEEKEGKKQ